MRIFQRLVQRERTDLGIWTLASAKRKFQVNKVYF